MYTKIASEIKQTYYQQNFNNDGQRFVAWYLRNVHLRDPNQAKYDITDGPDDKQIDAIVIDDNNSTVFIIQGKFIGAETIDAEPLREVLSSWVQIKNLSNLQEGANEKLKQRLVDLSNAIEDEYEIVFELVTTGTLTPSAISDLKRFQDEIAKNGDMPASLFLVDNEELKRRYDLALEKEQPSIKFSLQLESGKYVFMKIAETQAVVAAIPLKECIKFPGIKDGTLFRKNVRQSLGLNNRVNKSIRHTIYSSRYKDFFFYHNGITAICDKMTLNNDILVLEGVSVVNGCQSLSTILSCSEQVKKFDDSFILFRFYEIPQRERADKISISTNFQTAVKPRDLRSNDKRVLNIKRLFEQRYPQGYFITKRGEEAPASKDKNYIIDLVDLGKLLISWHSQRPNIAYSETKIFDKYFEQLFKREYDPENIQALNFWMAEIKKGWIPENPFGLNESLLAMKAYAPYHQLYAISQFFAIANNCSDRVPAPNATYSQASQRGIVSQLVNMGASCLNVAIEEAANEQSGSGKIFSPQNWIKTKSCLSKIKTSIRTQIQMLPNFPGGKELKESIILSPDNFEYRWEAD
ncbi:AIPR protein [Candidatus Woesearchaeota archaeon]|nr:MAG: AIPR protein [Candidatus Woesearchaeota archaeon]